MVPWCLLVMIYIELKFGTIGSWWEGPAEVLTMQSRPGRLIITPSGEVLRELFPGTFHTQPLLRIPNCSEL